MENKPLLPLPEKELTAHATAGQPFIRTHVPIHPHDHAVKWLKWLVIFLLIAIIILSMGLTLLLAKMGKSQKPTPISGASDSSSIEKLIEKASSSSAVSYSCPATKTINCMPIVTKDKEAQCSKAYLEWVKESCPGITVAY